MNHDCPQFHRVVGCDVAKHSVTLHDLASGRTFTVDNEPEALGQALAEFRGHDLAVCEATGGYEDVLLGVLNGLSIPAHRGHGTQISAYARSFGLAKTDRIDARVLALYGRERGPRLARWRPADEDSLHLVALVRRRMDLVELRKTERTRAGGPRAEAIAASLTRSLAFLDAEIAELDGRIRDCVTASSRLEDRRRVLRDLPGIGDTIAAGLLALMPELGTLDRRRAASLAAVAPHARDSGTIRKHRTTSGGRRELKPMLFLAALTAVRGKNVLADFYQRLVEAGKPKRLALTAVMRKIVVIANARLHNSKRN